MIVDERGHARIGRTARPSVARDDVVREYGHRAPLRRGEEGALRFVLRRILPGALGGRGCRLVCLLRQLRRLLLRRALLRERGAPDKSAGEREAPSTLSA